MSMTRNEIAQNFLNDLFGPIPDDSCIEIRTKRSGEQATRQLFIASPSVLRVDQYPPDVNVWFGVCLRRRGSRQGREEDLTWASCAWADFDKVTNKNEFVRRLKLFEHPPHFIIDSGGGLHAYWKFNRLLNLQDQDQATYLREVVHGLAYKLGGDMTVHDLPRVMRLPGTYNPGNGRTKVYDPPREAVKLH